MIEGSSQGKKKSEEKSQLERISLTKVRSSGVKAQKCRDLPRTRRKALNIGEMPQDFAHFFGMRCMKNESVNHRRERDHQRSNGRRGESHI